MKKIYLIVLGGALLFSGCNSKAALDYKNEVLNIQLSKDTFIELKRMDSGTFSMGSVDGLGEEDELPVREITLTNPFYMGTYEVTQAQWEYACRGGIDERWFFGDLAQENLLGEYAWIEENANHTTHPVGKKLPNPNGLYDIYGNLQEWCMDWYTNTYNENDVIDPEGKKEAQAGSKVVRGGNWGAIADMVRSGYRDCLGIDNKTNGIGFRCVIQ